MKKLLSQPGHRFVLEGALLGVLLLISLFSITVSFYVQGQMIARLDTPIMSTLAAGGAVSSETFEPGFRE